MPGRTEPDVLPSTPPGDHLLMKELPPLSRPPQGSSNNLPGPQLNRGCALQDFMRWPRPSTPPPACRSTARRRWPGFDDIVAPLIHAPRRIPVRARHTRHGSSRLSRLVLNQHHLRRTPRPEQTLLIREVVPDLFCSSTRDLRLELSNPPCRVLATALRRGADRRGQCGGAVVAIWLDRCTGRAAASRARGR